MESSTSLPSKTYRLSSFEILLNKTQVHFVFGPDVDINFYHSSLLFDIPEKPSRRILILSHMVIINQFNNIDSLIHSTSIMAIFYFNM